MYRIPHQIVELPDPTQYIELIRQFFEEVLKDTIVLK